MKKTYNKEMMETFFYKDGALFYKKDRGKMKAGQRAGTRCEKSPYRVITLNGEKFMEHRVIFFICNGYWPKVVDHINRDKFDNRIENLRGVTVSQNSFNVSNKPTGARLHKSGKWEAYASVDKKFKSLGYFNCETAAKMASAKFKIKISGGIYTPFSSS